tara:strand:- start:15 stop:593 length:579 start_codon:yes stop_codon:yes gene_type:complete
MSNGPSQVPTQSFMEHLKKREGFKENVYLDTLDKPTAGVGHLLTAEENALYNVGDRISPETTSQWLKQDSSKAYSAGFLQAKELGIEDQGMIEALGSVNFQLGTGWRDKFKGTWSAMKSGDFNLAASEAQFVDPSDPSKGTSKWMQQTPTRVKDFTSALRGYGESLQKKASGADIAMDAMSKIDNPLREVLY